MVWAVVDGARERYGVIENYGLNNKEAKYWHNYQA
jgi:hypothetical protein